MIIEKIRAFIECWKRSPCVYIYGAGFWARKYIHFAREYPLPIEGCVVSNGHKAEETIEGICIYELKDLIKNHVNNPVFVLGVDKRKRDEIRKILYSNGFCSILE